MSTLAIRKRATDFLSSHHPELAAYCALRKRDDLHNDNIIHSLTQLLEDVRIQERMRIRKHLCLKCDQSERNCRPP